MKLERTITLPELFLLAGTRGMLGMGVGLLVGEKMKRARRHTVGKTLLAVGALSSIPLAWRIFGKAR